MVVVEIIVCYRICDILDSDVSLVIGAVCRIERDYQLFDSTAVVLVQSFLDQVGVKVAGVLSKEELAPLFRHIDTHGW